MAPFTARGRLRIVSTQVGDGAERFVRLPPCRPPVESGSADTWASMAWTSTRCGGSGHWDRAAQPGRADAGLARRAGRAACRPAVHYPAAALRSWAVNLNKELTGSGVYAAHVGIDVSIDKSIIPGFPTAPASDIAAAYWDLHNKRQKGEFIFTLKPSL